jgi:hypothetical protein
MPNAEVKFISGNWVNNYTPEELTECYNQIVDYFTEKVKYEVFEKYNKPIAFKHQNV